jgi:NhaP-type Na+/H+ or K+/H+ antiporter
VFTLVLALLALGVVNMLKGDGILGVFVTGLAYNRTVGAMTYDKEREVEEGSAPRPAAPGTWRTTPRAPRP